MGYPAVKIAWLYRELFWHSTPADCDGRTDKRDGQTDGFTIAITALCIASDADAL